MNPQDPQSKDQWQEAVDAAHGMLTLDSARQYGLLTGGPVVDVARCSWILRHGKSIGIEPSADAVERLVIELTAGRSEEP